MLSKKDIFRELGKEINIVPLIEENIKENSINVTISERAWTMGTGRVSWCGNEEFHLTSLAEQPKHTHSFRAKEKAIFVVKEKEKENGKYLILLPHQTTIVETLEVIGLGSQIGGHVHSKVGVVAKGIGDTATMLGPGYCGHLMISLHNITDDVIALKVGDTFASLTFDYLDTPVTRTSATSSSHYDKLMEYGLHLSNDDKKYFQLDWKTNLVMLKREMLGSKEYRAYKDKYPDTFMMKVKQWLCVRNVVVTLMLMAILCGLGYWAYYADGTLEVPVWVDRYWAGLVFTLIAYVVPQILSILYKKN